MTSIQQMVPFVARWSEEVDPSPLRVIEGKLRYPDGENPIELDVLWMRERPGKVGAGSPQYGEVSTVRQRRCMLERLCQVCGDKIAGDTVSWLIPAVERRLLRIGSGPFSTTTPPVCALCAPIAIQHCPNLSRSAPTRLQVRNYRPIAVYGELVGADGRGHRKAELQLDDPRIPLMMARQLVVQVYDYRKERA